ncbi:Glycosyltransferase RgtA/B/C/D-like domain-containing protein OS=Streptomyces antimycoticus OX=68175 GN=SSPO_054280 PE=4 SV=1 [Streptomyces antimycoticus]
MSDNPTPSRPAAADAEDRKTAARKSAAPGRKTTANKNAATRKKTTTAKTTATGKKTAANKNAATRKNTTTAKTTEAPARGRRRRPRFSVERGCRSAAGPSKTPWSPPC